jgi:2-C-methyl-D-erythritol 2,4-cyclodiphosphate synthase
VQTLPFRVGTGFDAHAFAAEGADRPLVLGGVEVPGGPGLAGHSDGDVLLHAVVDALLGAAGMGDIGAAFGSSDPRYAGAASAVFVREAAARVRAAGWEPGNVDVTLVAARPRLAAHHQAMREVLADLLSLAPDAVNIKATTTDGLGALGRAEGIACLAVALLVKSQ